MKVIEINQSKSVPVSFIKGLSVKRSQNTASYPKEIIRKTIFEFEQDKIVFFSKLAGYMADSKVLPSIYINLIGFKLQMELMLHKDFPFSALGMVNISNKLIQNRPFLLNEIKKVECYFEAPKEHNRGIVYTVVSKTYDINNIVICENYAEQLKIFKKGEGNFPKKEFKAIAGNESEFAFFENSGRKFSKVSGDINPIHLFSITAKLLGFKGKIAHGMFSTSLALAQLEKEVAEINSFEFYTEYKQPIFLPAKTKFITQKNAKNETIFELVNKDKTKPHMVGSFKIN